MRGFWVLLLTHVSLQITVSVKGRPFIQGLCRNVPFLMVRMSNCDSPAVRHSLFDLARLLLSADLASPFTHHVLITHFVLAKLKPETLPSASCTEAASILTALRVKAEENKEWVVRFLRTNKQVSEKRMVEVLGDNKAVNERLLEQYVLLYEFKDLNLLECLRLFLKDFLLTGEGQQGTGPDAFAFESWDLVHFLTISFLMLNTDLHNKQNQDKMKLETFKTLFKAYPMPPEYL
ncbi:unnamed protein product [Arctogadus glacialis]